MTSAPTNRAHLIEFGAFRLAPAIRVVMRDGAPIALGDRALDLLIVLVERAGQVVSKQELFRLVWPNTVVEESNLRVNIAALRKALGDGVAGIRLIASVPGRGYSFVGDVRRATPEESCAPVRAEGDGGVPTALARIFGRDEIVSQIADEIVERRLISIVGTGGMGKTSVALMVTSKIASRFRDGVLFLDLAPLPNSELVAPHLASLLRLPVSDARPLEGIVCVLRTKDLLIVLDNCDHVVGAASELAEHILRWAPGVRLLATSREALRTTGEYVHRLEPLAVPPFKATLTAAEVREFPAVQLLSERVAATGSFEITDEEAPTVAEVCSRLDGLPLAIELAAARVGLFGFRGVADRLDDRFSILTKGRRTALPRHQTLTAMIDWSYESLLDDEKAVWRELSIFRASFTLDAAAAIARQPENRNGFDPVRFFDVLDTLVEKSLLSVDARGGTQVRYRLLESMRLYAYQKLAASGELRSVCERHARYFCDVSLSSGASWAETPSVEWLAKHTGDLADIRAALDWAFGPAGSPLLAIELTAASAPVWFKLLLVPELRRHLEHAVLVAKDVSGLDVVLDMRLHIALGHSIFHTQGPDPEVSKALSRALAIAEDLGDIGAQLQLIWAIFGNYSTQGDYAPMMSFVEKLGRACAKSTDPYAPAFYERVAALGFNLMGDQAKALGHARNALNHPAAAVRDRRHDTFSYDHRITVNSHYVRILWMQGRSETAWQVIEGTIKNAQSVDQPLPLGYFLVFAACPVAFWTGNLEAVRDFLTLQPTAASGMDHNVWRMTGELYEWALEIIEAEGANWSAARERLLQDPKITDFQAQTLATISSRFLTTQALAHTVRGETNWSTAEVLRAQGEMLLETGGSGARAEAESLFLRSIAISQRQNAPAWELRGTTSLARLWRQNGRADEANGLLTTIYSRLTEGFETRDLIEAKTLIDEPMSK